MRTAGRVLVPGMLMVALATAAPTMAATRTARSAPPEKGAAGLLVFPKPEVLPSETNNPSLGILAKAWQALAVQSERVLTSRSNRTAQVAIHRIRQAPDKPILLFLHGVLSDHETWRHIAAALAGEYELWLVDLPGCGDSDPLKRSAVEPDAYCLEALGERVLQAARRLLADMPPGRRLTLVGHSLGGSVVIRMVSCPILLNRYADVLDRVDRAVLVAPCDLAVNAVPTKFITVLGLKHWMLAVGNILGVTDPKIRKICSTAEQARRFAHIVKDKAHLKATQEMLINAVPFDKKTQQPIWPEIDGLVAEYANIRVPVLIAYGEWDETLPPAMGNKLKDEISDAWLVKIPGRGHALPTEDPEVCAWLIRWFHNGCKVQEFAGSPLKIYAPARPLSLPKSPPQ